MIIVLIIMFFMCSSIMIYDYEVIDWGEYELLVKSFSVTVNLVGAQSFFLFLFNFSFLKVYFSCGVKLKVTSRKCLRDGYELLWAFLSVWILC